MIAVCVDAGLPPPRFEEIATRFRVAIYLEQTGTPRLDEIDTALLARLADGEGLSTSELAAAIGLSSWASRSRLARLVEARLLAEAGTSPNDPKRRYYVAS